MKQQDKITSLQGLLNFIKDRGNFCVFDKGEEGFIIEAPNNADVFVSTEKDDNINDIILRTIESLEDFDADDRFMELWSKGFAVQNHFLPSHFIRILQEDEETFKGMAYQLRDFVDKK